MSIIKSLIDICIHLDKHLEWLIQNYGAWTYGIIFLVIFCETGLVVTPFLPGDSLLFTLGALAGVGLLDKELLFILLLIAAVGGDAANYWIGKMVGPKIFQKENVRFLNKKHLDQTHRFYEKYGSKTIILARFVPIIRTFAPFVAGIGQMSYRKFFTYNVVGALLWIILVAGAGCFFGSNPFVKKHFSTVVLMIIIVSLVPVFWEAFRAYFGKKKD